MIKTWRDIPGWFDFRDVYDQALSEALPGDFLIEVGAYLGKSTAYMVERIKEQARAVHFVTVDTWNPVAYARWWEYTDDPPKPWPVPELIGIPLAEAFLKCMDMTGSRAHVWPLGYPSLEVAAYTTNCAASFVFIDADHSYEAVKADIAAWTPKVRTGGLLAGHDYIPLWPGVVQAVDEAFGSRVEKRGSSWLVRL